VGFEQQSPVRESVRCMYPSELVALLWRHKHPRYFSVHIESNRWGDRQRDAVGLAPHGTIHFSEPLSRDEVFTVVCDCIPYTTIRDATFDQDMGRWKDGPLVRGWRPLISNLVKGGFLYPDKELDYLIGERTWLSSPKHTRL